MHVFFFFGTDSCESVCVFGGVGRVVGVNENKWEDAVRRTLSVDECAMGVSSSRTGVLAGEIVVHHDYIKIKEINKTTYMLLVKSR